MNASICLATYNGEKYIKDQIKSIIMQMEEQDELIVSDDCSIDNTLSIIEEINDKRIKIIRSDKNYGHVKNFEKAIEIASKDIILLSDQDDVWKAHKLRTVKNLFHKYPNISIIYHGLDFVDQELNPIKKTYSRSSTCVHKGFLFAVTHIFKGRIFGCSSAFRSRLKNTLLPFPDYIIAHDHWLGIIGGFSGDVIEIDESLVFYRQHEHNITPKNLNLIRSITSRVSNLRSIFRAIQLTLIH